MEKKDATQLRQWLCIYRIRHNINQKEMAEILGISNNKISNIENGRDSFTEYYYNLICRVLKLDAKDRQFLSQFVAKRREIPYQKKDIEQAYLKAVDYIKELEIRLGITRESDEPLWEFFLNKDNAFKKCKNRKI